MQYGKYYERISKIANILKTVRRFRVLICSVVAVIVVLTSSYLVTKGLVYDGTECPQTVRYGDELSYRAEAIFESVRYEYSSDKDFLEMLESVPRLPGSYYVRAVSTSVFGNVRYGEVHKFTIVPREIDVLIVEDKILYGKNPTVEGDVAAGDTIKCRDFVYADLSKKETDVTAVLSSISVMDANGDDVTWAYSFNPVSKKIAFDPRNITVTVSSAESIYNGFPFSFDGYELSRGSLASFFGGVTDKLIATFDDSITDVGSIKNNPEIRVIGKDNADVTANYNINVVEGTLTVNKYPIEIFVEDAELDYNGKAQSHEEFKVSENTALVEGHTASVSSSTAITDHGTVENLLTFDITDENGKNVTDNYSIFVSQSFITVNKRVITVSTSDATFTYDGEVHQSLDFTVTSDVQIAEGQTASAVGTTQITDVLESGMENKFEVSIADEDGNDVTANYEISYVFGALTVEPKLIKFTTEDKNLEYNGQKQVHEGFIIDSDTALAEGHTAIVVENTSIVNVSDGEVENILSLAVVDEEGNDKSSNYTFELTKAGILTVYPRSITVTADDAAKAYDGTPLTGKTVSVDRLPEGQEISAALIGSQTLIGESDVAVVDGSVSIVCGEEKIDLRNYKMTFAKGTLTVSKYHVVIVTATDEWTYDGETHYNATAEAHEDTPLVEGHSIKVLTYSSVTTVGEGVVDNEMTVTILDEDGNDLSENYHISYEYGALRILPRPVTVITEGQTWTYDGLPHSWDKYAVSEETPLLEGHRTRILSVPVITNAWEGPTDNNILVAVEDESGVDMSVNYEITYDCGKIAVMPEVINVTTPSGEWMYDGCAHAYHEYSLDFEIFLLNGYSVVVEEAASITNVWDGPIDNKLTLSVWYDGVDVTQNFELRYEYGTLEILPRPVTIQTGSASWEYDREYHSSPAANVVGGEWLVEGHEIFVNAEDCPEIIELGTKENKFAVKIIDEQENEYTGNYDITYNYGTIEIIKRTVYVIANSSEREYDGTPLTNAEVTVYNLLPFHTLYATTYGSQTDVGQASNIVVDGSVVIVEEDGSDAGKYYNVVLREGTLTVFPRTIIIKAASDKKIYDATPLSRPEYLPPFTPDERVGLVLDHVIVEGTVTVWGSGVDAGMYDNYIEGPAQIYCAAEDRDVTFNYDIHYAYGALEIEPRPMNIYADTASKEYDGTPLTCPTYTVEGTGDLEPLVEGQTIIDDWLSIVGSITDPGEAPNNVEGYVEIWYEAEQRYVTHNYNIQYVSGTLIIEKREIIIRAGSNSKIYDGKPLTYNQYTLSRNDDEPLFIFDHRLVGGSIKVEGTITEIGKAPNIVSGARIYSDSEGRDVTDIYYNIVYDSGTLTVTDENGSTGEDEGGGGSGGGGGGDIDDSGKINGGPLGGGGGGDTVAMEIFSSVSGPVYLRYKSFGSYNGQGWEEASEYPELLDGKYSYNYLMSIVLENCGYERSTIGVKLNTNQIFLPYYMGVGDFDYDIQTSDVIYTGQKSQFTLDYYNYTGFGMELVGNLGEYAELEAAYREYVHDTYLDIDPETLAFMQGIIAEEQFDAEDLYIIELVEEYIQNSANYSLNYDRALDEAENVVIAFLSEYKEGICQHYAAAATLLYRALGIPARWTLGYSGYAIAGQWSKVTTKQAHAWVEVYIDGVGWVYSEVTGSGSGGELLEGEGGGGGGPLPPPELEIRPVDVVEEYNGSAYYAENKLAVEFDSLLEELLNEGYTYDVTVVGSRTEKGTSFSRITDFTLYDPNGNDVTDQFAIVCKPGTIKITETQVVIWLFSSQKYYNGTALEYAPDEFFIYKCPDGITVDFTLSGSRTDAGVMSEKELRKLPITLYDANGNDVTDEYYVKFVGDFLRVDKRRITIKAASETKAYDGTPLTNDTIEFVFGELVEGHTIVAPVKGSITLAGSVENMIDKKKLKIVDADGNDVTDNYKITCEPGVLTVVP